MELAAISELIGNYGMAFVLMGYFLMKDWRQTSEIINTLASIREVLAELKGLHNTDD